MARMRLYGTHRPMELRNYCHVITWKNQKRAGAIREWQVYSYWCQTNHTASVPLHVPTFREHLEGEAVSTEGLMLPKDR